LAVYTLFPPDAFHLYRTGLVFFLTTPLPTSPVLSPLSHPSILPSSVAGPPPLRARFFSVPYFLRVCQLRYQCTPPHRFTGSASFFPMWRYPPSFHRGDQLVFSKYVLFFVICVRPLPARLAFSLPVRSQKKQPSCPFVWSMTSRRFLKSTFLLLSESFLKFPEGYRMLFFSSAGSSRARAN